MSEQTPLVAAISLYLHGDMEHGVLSDLASVMFNYDITVACLVELSVLELLC